MGRVRTTSTVVAVSNPSSWIFRMAVAVVAGALFVTACVTGLAPNVWSALHAHEETPVKLPAFSGLATRTQILDVNNRQIGVFEFENSQPLSIDDVPDRVVAALLAVEDSGFERHKGVNQIGRAHV